MRLRRLQLRLATDDGPYGGSLDFPDGLLVVWADNSMGKSTCVKSILVALGMEAMLTTSRTDLPLPPAVTSILDAGDQQFNVIEADIFLEIENLAGRRITIQRTVKGSRDADLVTVHDGPVLTDSHTSAATTDYFVNRSGSAQRESGFHHFLAEFMGWVLPVVQTYDGYEYPLYLQCVFPFLVVEQTRGWATIQPPLPTHFRIRDVHKRTIEFLVGLEAYAIGLRRQELTFEKVRIESEWAARLGEAVQVANGIEGTVHGLPQRPIAEWPPLIPPGITVPSGDSWLTLTQRIQQAGQQHQALVQQEIPRVQEIASSAALQLSQVEDRVKEREVVLARLLDAFRQEQEEAKSVRLRIDTLDEDIQRNKDAKTLRQLGSRRDSLVESGLCPVCHQHIQDSLIPLAAQQAVMSLDDNIRFLAEQRRTFESVLANSERITESRERQVRMARQELGELREQVRALKQTLVSDGRLPSIAALQSRLQLEGRIAADTQSLERFNDIVAQFTPLAARWHAIAVELSAMPADDVTENDRAKLREWTRLFQQQLREYGFRSLPTGEVTISEDTYRPEHSGFDLQTSISASDLIRTIWSYLHGLLELSRSMHTNHPGLIVFDEPRQQSTREVSFAELLRRASTAAESRQQVVFFTSENRSALQQQLSGLPHSLVAIDGRFLTKQE